MKTKSTEQQTNTKVWEQLQEYAQLYFVAIIEANTTDGECKLKIGKYSARELVSMDRDYELPRDTMFDEDITIKEGSFQCTIQYRQIFYILAKWEQMMRAGKQKAVFEVGEAEEKSAKVLLQETTPTGRYKEKRVRMQRVTGNWWASRKADRDGKFALYYELNGVIFIAKYWSDDPQSESTKKWCAEYGDAEIKKLVIDFLVNFPESKFYGYFSEVARRANIKEEARPAATDTETAQISTETAETVDCTAEGEIAHRTAKNMGQVEQIKINRTNDNMYCVEMYISGVLVDCVNGITEAEKNDYKRLYERGKLTTPNYLAATRPPESPPTSKCVADPRNKVYVRYSA